MREAVREGPRRGGWWQQLKTAGREGLQASSLIFIPSDSPQRPLFFRAFNHSWPSTKRKHPSRYTPGKGTDSLFVGRGRCSLSCPLGGRNIPHADKFEEAKRGTTPQITRPSLFPPPRLDAPGRCDFRRAAAHARLAAVLGELGGARQGAGLHAAGERGAHRAVRRHAGNYAADRDDREIQEGPPRRVDVPPTGSKELGRGCRGGIAWSTPAN